MKPAPPAGLADLIDNLGAALPAAPLFLIKRAGCG
jgi:hypothetical protein